MGRINNQILGVKGLKRTISFEMEIITKKVPEGKKIDEFRTTYCIWTLSDLKNFP